jgi:hypothetical protein
LKSETIPFTPALVPVGTATTDGGGNFSLSLAALGSQQVFLKGTYTGDSQHWPAYDEVFP